MTPKEKAKQLFDSFMDIGEEQDKTLIKYLEKLSSNSYNTPRYLSKDIAKQCALITCNEVLGYMGADRGYEFWTEVKQEIEQL